MRFANEMKNFLFLCKTSKKNKSQTNEKIRNCGRRGLQEFSKASGHEKWRHKGMLIVFGGSIR